MRDGVWRSLSALAAVMMALQGNAGWGRAKPADGEHGRSATPGDIMISSSGTKGQKNGSGTILIQPLTTPNYPCDMGKKFCKYDLHASPELFNVSYSGGKCSITLAPKISFNFIAIQEDMVGYYSRKGTRIDVNGERLTIEGSPWEPTIYSAIKLNSSVTSSIVTIQLDDCTTSTDFSGLVYIANASDDKKYQSNSDNDAGVTVGYGWGDVSALKSMWLPSTSSVPYSDCDNDDAFTYYDAQESCDGKDNDCRADTPADQNCFDEWSVKWQFAPIGPDGRPLDVLMVPTVGNLTDDNGDGIINSGDTPDIVFVGLFPGNGSWEVLPESLYALSGDDGQLLWQVGNMSGAGVAIGDADADGVPEVYAVDRSGYPVSYSNTGGFRWRAATPVPNSSYVYPALGDMNGDGAAEILFGFEVYTSEGGRVLVTPNGSGLSFFYDMNLDGQVEIVSGAGISSSQGESLRGPFPGYFASVANIDGDGYPEIVNSGYTSVSLYDDITTDFALLWTATVPDGSAVETVVGDVDGDGSSEIVLPSKSTLRVFGADGTLKWQHSLYHTSGPARATLFDFDNDGAAEIIYGDEETLWVFDGMLGYALLEESRFATGTVYERPVVADIDGDGNAELVVPAANYLHSIGDGSWSGIVVLEPDDDSWSYTRPVWNQGAYFSNNVRDNLTIPPAPATSSSFGKQKVITGQPVAPQTTTLLEGTLALE